jgi:hypothetical protein
MKRAFACLALVLPLLLAGCGGSSSATVSCQNQYWDGEAGLCLPSGWSVIDREAMDLRQIPPETIAAFQAEESVSGQFPTITILREDVPGDADSPSYSSASIRSVSTLPEYKLVSTKKIQIDGADVELHVFTAKPIPDEPERRFYQVSAVHDAKGYTFTALTPVSVNSSLDRQIETILRSARLTDPEGASSSAK